MNPPTAALYVRISQDREGAGLGVERQTEDCTALAARLGWTVTKVFTDNDVSAYSGKRRPAYRELLDAIERGEVAGVIAWHPDRLHRSPAELEEFIALVEKRGVVTHTVQAGAWDLSSASGRAIARTLGAWARYESEHKGDRIRRASQQRLAAGAFNGGIRPYGWERDGLTVVPEEAEVIRSAAEQVIAGVSLRQIVRDLNERGIPTASGRARWSSQAMRDKLVSPRSAGLTSYKGEVLGRGQWGALIDEDMLAACQAILLDPARRTTPGATPKWLGSGLYVCEVCGQRRIRVGHSKPRKDGTKIPAYRCAVREDAWTSGHVMRQAPALDAYVEEVIVGRLQAGDVADLFAREDAKTDVGSLHVEKSGLEARLDELATRYALGEITGRQMSVASERMRGRLDEISAALAAAATSNPLVGLPAGEDIRAAWFGTREDRSDGFLLARRRAILDALVDVVILNSTKRGGVSGRRNFDPSSVRFDWKV